MNMADWLALFIKISGVWLILLGGIMLVHAPQFLTTGYLPEPYTDAFLTKSILKILIGLFFVAKTKFIVDVINHDNRHGETKDPDSQ